MVSSVHSLSRTRLSTASITLATLITPTNTISAAHTILLNVVNIVAPNGHEQLPILRRICVTTPFDLGSLARHSQKARTHKDVGHRDQKNPTAFTVKIVATTNQTSTIPWIRSVAPQPRPAVENNVIWTIARLWRWTCYQAEAYLVPQGTTFF